MSTETGSDKLPRVFAAGQYYLSVYDKRDPECKLIRIQVRSIRTCRHKESICKKCAREWEQDWQVIYHRTVAGRKLHRELEVADATAEMVGRGPATRLDWCRFWASSDWDSVRMALAHEQKAVSLPLNGRQQVPEKFQQVTCTCGATTYEEHKKAILDRTASQHTYTGPYKPISKGDG